MCTASDRGFFLYSPCQRTYLTTSILVSLLPASSCSCIGRDRNCCTMCWTSLPIRIRKSWCCWFAVDTTACGIASVRLCVCILSAKSRYEALTNVVNWILLCFVTTTSTTTTRKRLKGCEAEVANMLDDRWKPIVLEWEIAMDDEDVPLDERRI